MLPIPFGRRPLRLGQAVVLFAAALIAFFVFLLIVADSGNPADRDCRDDVLSQVPVYPQATLVDRDESGSKPAAGSEWRAYETSDSPDEIAAFYREVSSCADPESGSEDQGVLCEGQLDGNHRVNFQARISPAADVTSVSLFIGWYCGTRD